VAPIGGSGKRRGLGLVSPKSTALAGVVLASASGFVLLFAGYGGEAATCPESDPAWVGLLAVGCAAVATLGMAAAVWAYRATAGEPSGEWLLGAAGLYVTTLAWTATIAGAGALLVVDLCSL
jgi:hypothetical protein